MYLTLLTAHLEMLLKIVNVMICISYYNENFFKVGFMVIKKGYRTEYRSDDDSLGNKIV